MEAAASDINEEATVLNGTKKLDLVVEDVSCSVFMGAKRGKQLLWMNFHMSNYFCQKQTDYGIVGQPFTKSGWGFVFQKVSPLAVDMSTRILKLAETWKLQELHEKWFCKHGCASERGRRPERNELHLSSFLALFLQCGGFTLAALVVFLIRNVRQYMRYTRKQMEPYAPSSSAQSRARFSDVDHNFFDFIDEKELEAIKKMFTQRDDVQPQVSESGI